VYAPVDKKTSNGFRNRGLILVKVQLSMLNLMESKKMKKETISPDGCPYCNSWEVEYDGINIDGSMAEQHCYCNDYGAAWWKVYDFVGIEYDKDGSNRLEHPE